MKLKFLFFLMLSSLSFSSLKTFACDSLKAKQFNSMAESFKKRMKEQSNFSNEDAVSLIKVYNTFHIAEYLERSKTFALEFISLFDKYYLKVTCKQLDCTFGKGMTIYSKKHDLYIGIEATYRCKDHFIVN